MDAIREVRITEETCYRWRNQYGGVGTDQMKELRRLQKENERRPPESVFDLVQWITAVARPKPQLTGLKPTRP